MEYKVEGKAITDNIYFFIFVHEEDCLPQIECLILPKKISLNLKIKQEGLSSPVSRLLMITKNIRVFRDSVTGMYGFIIMINI